MYVTSEKGFALVSWRNNTGNSMSGFECGCLRKILCIPTRSIHEFDGLAQSETRQILTRSLS